MGSTRRLYTMAAVDSSTCIPSADPPNEGGREVTDNRTFRLDNPLDDVTNVVKELFGSEFFGRCFGEFACSHSRIRGRLYATSEAILFYSNVLGFEKRIFLYYQDIIEMELFRTTSISISTAEGETYVFKSFEKRKEVLRLLKSLEMMAATSRATAATAVATTTPSPDRRRTLQMESLYGEDAFSTPTNGINATAIGQHEQPQSMTAATAAAPSSLLSASQTTNTMTTNTPSSSIVKRTVSYKNLAMPVLGNRRRAISDSVMSSIELFEDIAETSLDAHNAVVSGSSSSSSSPPPSQLSRPQTTQGLLSPSIASSKRLTWDQVKAKGPLQNQAIESLILPCSLDKFFEIFLADDAQFSLLRYQKDYVKDRDLQATKWSIVANGTNIDNSNGNSSNTVMTRTLCFSHPIKNAIGLGPSEARTTRKQTLERFDNVGILLENTTIVEGIPAADTFRLTDQWLIETLDSCAGVDQIKLSSSFEVKFIRRSLLRGIIEKSVRKETGDWWAGYEKMLQTALTEKTGATNALPDSRQLLKEDRLDMIQKYLQDAYWLLTVMLIVACFCLVALCMQLYMVQKELSGIQKELILSRQTLSAQCVSDPILYKQYHQDEPIS